MTIKRGLCIALTGMREVIQLGERIHGSFRHERVILIENGSCVNNLIIFIFNEFFEILKSDT
jgi:hypothetical protein